MLDIHPEILRKDGKEQFVILTYEEFLLIQERLEDATDVLELRRAKADEGDEPTVPLEEVKRSLGIDE